MKKREENRVIERNLMLWGRSILTSAIFKIFKQKSEEALMKKKVIGIIAVLIALIISFLLMNHLNQSPEKQANTEQIQSTLDNESDQDGMGNSSEKDDQLNKDEPSVTPLKLVQEIPVLYYHAVRNEAGNELCMPPEELEAQMQYLAQNGYHSLTLDQFYEGLSTQKGFPEKGVVITFDDGYVDNFTNAFPILKKYGFKATVFMVTDYADHSGYLSWEQMKTMEEAGWQIEGHAVSHPSLSDLSSDALDYELKESKLLLEEHLKKTVKSLAYPYGIYNAQVVKKAEDLGYTMGFTTERGWARLGQSLMRVPRVYCYAGMGTDEFIKRVTNPQY